MPVISHVRLDVTTVPSILDKRSQPFDNNGNNVGCVMLWDTGTSRTWAWDRLTVDLKEGDNRIRIQANGRIMMDHVNMHYVGQYSYGK